MARLVGVRFRASAGRPGAPTADGGGRLVLVARCDIHHVVLWSAVACTDLGEHVPCYACLGATLAPIGPVCQAPGNGGGPRISIPPFRAAESRMRSKSTCPASSSLPRGSLACK